MHPKIKKFWEESGWTIYSAKYQGSTTYWWGLFSDREVVLALMVKIEQEMRYYLPGGFGKNDPSFSEEEFLHRIKMKAFW